MDIIGVWKVAEAQTFNKQTFKLDWRKAEDILADDSLEDYEKQPISMRFLFTEDGKIKTLSPIPEGVTKEELDEAIASGECSLYDENTIVVEEKEWKEEDGKIVWNTGVKGEVMDEEINPWAELKQTDNGIEMMTFRLVKE
ncbi:MAG: hypothetical protein IKO47_13210 [Ruminococcus sp.]|nr:hypothetical protein [Ruminococcus sp.]